MPTITFDDEQYALAAGETVLTCLERHGRDVPNSCRSGVCQSCMMKAVDGAPPPASQKGLKDTHIAQGYFLSCVCAPEEDLSITEPGAGMRHTGSIAAITPLSDAVIGVRIRCATLAHCRAGQFVNLVHPEGAVRSYSVAAVGGEGDIALHVARMPNGVMSGWLHSHASPGDAIDLLGPHGACFYVEGAPDQPLLLVGTGTGLAPLFGVAADALGHGHTGPIHLFHGSVRASGLYLDARLRELAAAHPNFHYHPCVLEAENRGDAHVGMIDGRLADMLPDLAGWRAFLCGPDDLVRKLQREVFLAGVSMNEIFADAFLPAAPPSPAPTP